MSVTSSGLEFLLQCARLEAGAGGRMRVGSVPVNLQCEAFALKLTLASFALEAGSIGVSPVDFLSLSASV
jgi:hypothetical protein